LQVCGINLYHWDVLDVVDFKELTDSIYSSYNIYYDEEWKYLFEDCIEKNTKINLGICLPYTQWWLAQKSLWI